MKWITRAHVHVDRVACPWLITRFIDANAEFLFVDAASAAKVAGEQNAIPFDIPDAELGHHEGHCSFVSIINKYGLKDKALLKLADIINAADTGQPDKNQYATGLEAIARGYGILYPFDPENLKHQFTVYDALYAFCKMQAASEK
ncbi:MAG: chromate resistance protein ChrB domain-containing protein [Planctomycetota bacterium]